jgi:hypothetical protein
MDFQRVGQADPEREAQLRLTAMTWTNPHPEKQINSIDMSLAPGIKVEAFLVAATLERD